MKILPIPLQKQYSKKDSLSLRFIIHILFSLLAFAILTRETLSAQNANDDHVSTHIDNPITINPTDNDSGCGSYNVAITAAPQHGTTSTIAANGSFTYTPNSGFSGRDSLQYSITCNGNSDLAKVYILVMPFPDNVYNMNCVTIPDSTQWGIMRGDSSTLTAHMYAQPYAGDIDNDGDIEIVAVGHYNSPQFSHSIVIYNSHLVQEISISTSEIYVYGGYPIAIADVDHDGIAEIYVHTTNGVLQCYNYNGASVTTKWTSSQTIVSERSAILAIADANADGIPDILCLNKIYNAVTGVLEVTLPATVGQATTYGVGRPTMPVFADMDNDGILEVVGGNTVIKVNITNANGTTGNSAFIWKTLSGTNIGDGLTSVADIDLDGYMDVVVVKTNLMYVWKPYSGIGSSSQLIGTNSFNASNSSSGSRALVADINNDGYPEIAWTYALNMRACYYNTATNSINQLWHQTTTDGSGATTMTVFDFNQDGSAEIVYRDQTLLRIINGNTGTNISTFSCPAPTAVDYPIIVDLNQDGSAEIVVSTCAFISGTVLPAKIISFTALNTSNRWAPARHVWNQHGYNVVHINDDLTVPQYQFNPVTPLTDPNTPSIVRRPFNNFLQQATSIDQYGIPFFTQPDATVVNDSTVVSNNCDSTRISIFYKNEGDNVLSAPYKITVYKDTYRGPVILTATVNSNLYPDSSSRVSFSFSSADLLPFQPISDLVFALNDGGTGIAQNGNQQTECDTTNNILTLPFNGFSSFSLSTCNDTTINFGDTAYLNVSGANFYNWSFNSTLSDSTISNPTATPNATTMYYVTGYVPGGNIIYNGDFSLGNVGFTSNYIYTPSAPAFGTYTVATNTSTGWWQTCTGTGMYMMVDGSPTPNTIVWQQTVTVNPNTTYALSALVTTIAWAGTNPAQLKFSINGTQVGNIITTPLTLCNWLQFNGIWNNNTATQAIITITDQTNIGMGNDFGLENISFSPICTGKDSVLVTVIFPQDTIYFADSICKNTPYLQHGFDTLFATAGHYTLTRLENSYPRDTLILVNLTVFPTYQINLTDGICQGEPYTENGFDISADSTQIPGTIIHRQLTFLSSAGCDSIMDLELTVYPFFNPEMTKEACNYYRWNDETYYDSGDYLQYFTSAHGCDSTVTLHLSIIDAEIEIINLTADFCEEYFSILTANSTIENILWSTGEISDTIIVRYPGNYSVSISLANCNAEDAITIPPCDFNLYLPNTITPSNHDGLNDYFMLPLNETPQISEAEIEIYDRWGKMVFISKDIYFKWDGNVNGIILSNTVFNYRLLVKTQMRKPMMFTGSITVL